MNSLVLIQNNQTITTSKMVADAFEKEHKNVLRDIENLDCSPDFHKLNFELMLITNKIGNGANRQDKAYNITRDGFTFLAMGYTGKRAAEFKEAYIKAFNEMEEKLQDQKFIKNGGYNIYDLIIAQARSMRDSEHVVYQLKKEVDEIKRALSAPVAIPSLNEIASTKHVLTPAQYFSVAEYTTGKQYTHTEKALIGYWAKIYSAKNQLNITSCDSGNKYLAEALDYAITKIKLTKKQPNETSKAELKFISEIKKNPTAQIIIRLSVGQEKNFRSTLRSKLKSLIYTKINPNTPMQYSITANGGWVKVRRIK